MTSPESNISALSRFESNALPASGPNNAMEAAERAMTELVDQARQSWMSPYPASPAELAVRAKFANAYLFERFLTPDIAQKERDAFKYLAGTRYYRRGKARLEMLEGIYKAATGGLFPVVDPSGLTSWIGDEITGLDVVTGTLTSDDDPEVIAATLRLLADVAAPMSWFPRLQQERILDRLDVRARESTWGTAERRVISALTARAAQRVSTELARSASGQLPHLEFPTGSGTTPTTPPPASQWRWYRSGWTWAAAALATVSGSVAAARRSVR